MLICESPFAFTWLREFTNNLIQNTKYAARTRAICRISELPNQTISRPFKFTQSLELCHKLNQVKWRWTSNKGRHTMVGVGPVGEWNKLNCLQRPIAKRSPLRGCGRLENFRKPIWLPILSPEYPTHDFKGRHIMTAVNVHTSRTGVRSVWFLPAAWQQKFRRTVSNRPKTRHDDKWQKKGYWCGEFYWPQTNVILIRRFLRQISARNSSEDEFQTTTFTRFSIFVVMRLRRRRRRWRQHRVSNNKLLRRLSHDLKSQRKQRNRFLWVPASACRVRRTHIGLVGSCMMRGCQLKRV